MRTSTPEGETVWGGRREKFANPDSRIWLDRMAERGWTAPTWPREYGGGGLTADEDKVLQQELRSINAQIEYVLRDALRKAGRLRQSTQDQGKKP